MDSFTEQKEGAYFPQTTIRYRCTNASCQEEIDKQTEKRLKQKTERQEENKRRAEERILQKNLEKLH